MAHNATVGPTSGGAGISRRTLLGGALAVGVIGGVVLPGTAYADDCAEDPEAEGCEEYPIPDETGSAPWW